MANQERHAAEAIMAAQKSSRQIHRASNSIKAYAEAGDGLSGLNTMRGGTKGFKGFVMEEMEAAESSACGRATQVLGDNGLADLRHVKVDGRVALKQMKAGYRPGQIDFARYKGQTVVVDKGNPYFRQLKAEGAKAGVKVVEGHVTAGEAKFLSDAMQMETKLTGSKNAVIAPRLYQGAKTVTAAHKAGISSAKAGAAGGAGFSLGSNLVQVAKGNKTVGEAAGDVVVDTVKAGATSYGIGAAASAIGSTTAGAAALGTLSTAATTVASAPVIGSVVSAGGAAATAIGGIGSMAAAPVAAGLTALGATGAAAALTVAAPVAAVGVVLGGICSLFSD